MQSAFTLIDLLTVRPGSGRAGRVRRGGSKAFSLVELLVVVTIITVLMALLAPAMDQAIYQAELAVCGANQRTTAGAVTLYAAGNKRSYPYRPGVRDDVAWA